MAWNTGAEANGQAPERGKAKAESFTTTTKPAPDGSLSLGWIPKLDWLLLSSSYLLSHQFAYERVSISSGPLGHLTGVRPLALTCRVLAS
jgi:hypothetical protein